LRRFSGRLIVAALAIVGGYFVAGAVGLKLPTGDDRGSDPGASVAAASSELADGESDGNALMTRVVKTLEHWPNVAAQFRQVVRIADEPLSGAGEYWQQGVGNQRRTCWQWQTLVEDQKAVFRQVYDKNSHLWTDCRFPERRTVTRVDLIALRRELNLLGDSSGQGRAGELGQSRTGEREEDLEILARGGLSQLVAELRQCFTFGPPTVVVEEGRPLLVVVGRWRAEALSREWPSLAPDAAGGWPAHLPHHVVVKVGQSEFFPYVIEYRRGADAALVGQTAATADPLARYEFFDVRWAVTMPERLFEFTATDVDWHDVTARTLERLRPPKPVAEVALRDEGWRQYQ
jgi:hypothetical protein